MKLTLIFLLLVPFIGSASIDLDPEDELNEDQFEEYFQLDPVTDPEEHERREKALKENEALIKENNDQYLSGNRTWWDAVNEFADLPADEFLAEKTGDSDEVLYGRGLLEPAEEDRIDEESERYFDMFRYSRASVPDSYSSVDKGFVSPVKDQRQCGSCVAFANMALIETCFKKTSGVFGDYSEQQLLDCGFGQNGADGCDGAPTYAYAKWASTSNKELVHESTYPYLNKKPKLSCPTGLEGYNQGAKVTDASYTYFGDEETLKKLVYEHGAVSTSVQSKGPFQEYKGGIFAGCPSNSKTDHAVTVVGYGNENGQDYWLIKNSWGQDWGENGFIRLKRGVGMCGIGKAMVTVKCEKVAGPTDPPMTTKAPCFDAWSSCPDRAKEKCYQPRVADKCKKSCGLCPGLTPAPSYTCYDEFGNCADLAKTKCYKYGPNCKKSCGLCDGMTPAPSNTCYDEWSNCPELAKTNCKKHGPECKKSCGLCDGMTPHKTNTCYSKYGNCADFCHTSLADTECKLACGKC